MSRRLSTPPAPIDRQATPQTQRMHPMQSFALAYAALFLFVVAIGYLPGLTDGSGQLLGLFRIELIDDALHLGSGIWAALAAYSSARAATLYFKLFGSVYGLGGVIGLLFGQGFLDGGIFTKGPTALDLATRVGANLPHLVIGGTAVLIGFVLSRRYRPLV
jgi:hypothetical protein